MCSKARCARRGNRVRITAQLIDATSGAHLWADRFDGSLEDVFELQDRVCAAGVAGVIEPALQARPKPHRSANRPTNDLTACTISTCARPGELSLAAEAEQLLQARVICSRAGDRAANPRHGLGAASLGRHMPLSTLFRRLGGRSLVASRHGAIVSGRERRRWACRR